MKRASVPVTAILLFLINNITVATGQTTVATGQTARDVLTNHNDKYRTGVYAGETILRPRNVKPGGFGKVFARRVLGQIWGQPLYVQGVPVNGRLRSVVYVATSENMIYGFDADDRTPDEQTPPLMNVYLGAPDAIEKDSFNTILPSNGISSTPVIDLGNPPDPRTGTLYVVAKLKEDHKFHVFALDLSTLAIRPNAQGQLTDVIVCEAGRCASNSTLRFEPSRHMNRPALLISKNHLIVAFGSGPPENDHDPNYQGWVMSFSLPDLVQTDAFVTTPTSDTGMGAVWQSGAGPAADDQGNIYFMTGNGHFEFPNLSDSFVKLANRDGKLPLADWYTPRSRDVLEVCDLDLGTSGPVVIQDSGKVLGAGKSGILYVLDKDNLGRDQPPLSDIGRSHWRGDPDCSPGPGQCFRVAESQYQFQAGMKESKHRCDTSGFKYDPPGFNDTDKSDDSYWEHVVMSYPHVHGSPVVWRFGTNSYNLYVWPESDFLKAYRFDGQQFSPSPIGSSAPLTAAMMSMPGGVLSLSWDGHNPNTAIIWASRPNPNTKAVAGDPFVSAFHDQQHFVFRDKHGAIWDTFYQRDQNTWSFQEISTNGLPAASNIFVSVFGSADQQHFVYTDNAGNIWDSFYRRAQGSWDFQPIDSHGTKPVGRVYVSAFYDQQHFVFRDLTGTIWDSFYSRADEDWYCYQINPSGHPAPTDTRCEQIDTNGPPAASDIFVSDFGDQQHFSYTDSSGNIWDSYYRKDHGWKFQQIDTFGQTLVGGIFVSAFYDQQHFAFRDLTGTIWDSFYSRADDKWHCNQINPSGHPAPTDTRCEQIDTNGPPAASDRFVADFGDQQHFSYADSTGNIWDSFYRKDHGWKFQQISTFGHTPAGRIFVSAFYDQQRFVYADAAGILWDSFYSDADHHWHFQQINGCMFSQHGDYKQDMSPNDARCNAINKIVPGYLQAFNAMPGRNGQLAELWNSEDDPKDTVEWFAKSSPPTVADGKVFVAEFPAKPEKEKWNDANAFGRLLMYSLLRE